MEGFQYPENDYCFLFPSILLSFDACFANFVHANCHVCVSMNFKSDLHAAKPHRICILLQFDGANRVREWHLGLGEACQASADNTIPGLCSLASSW